MSEPQLDCARVSSACSVTSGHLTKSFMQNGFQQAAAFGSDADFDF
jgi:hypothetical protein